MSSISRRFSDCIIGLLTAALLCLGSGAVAATTANLDYEVIGTVRTPSSDSANAWNGEKIAIAVFEQLSSDTIIYVIDRHSSDVQSFVLPASYIVYSLVFDPNDKDILWAATSQSAQLFKINVAQASVEKIATFGDKNFIFSIDVSRNGDVFVGTYPDAGLFDVAPSGGSYKVSAIEVPSALIGGRTNIKTIVADNDGLVLFEVGSPGELIAYDTASRKSAVVLRTDEPFFFPMRDFPGTISSIQTPADFYLHKIIPGAADKWGNTPRWANRLLSRTVFSVHPRGMSIDVAHDGTITELSGQPRHGGMPIVSFVKINEHFALGATYWNQWAFRFDLDSRIITPLGPIGKTGEFFTACPYEGGAAIPHYLGLLLKYDPNEPISAGERQNPRTLLEIPNGHIGLSCTQMGSGELVYSMLPNYGQHDGLIVKYDGNSDPLLVDLGQTVGRVIKVDDRLYASTSTFIGLGIHHDDSVAPLRVMELDPHSLAIKRSIVIDAPTRYRNSVGLVRLSKDKLLLGVEGSGLFVIETAGAALHAHHVGNACVGASSLTSLSDGYVAALCADRAYMYSDASQGLAEIASLKPGTSFMFADSISNLVFSSGGDILKVAAEKVKAAERVADETPADAMVISGGDLPLYSAKNVLVADSASWLSSQIGADAIANAYIGFEFKERSIAAIEANMIWVTPGVTPAQVKIEYSDDAKSWVEVLKEDSIQPPNGVIAYWKQHFTWNDAGAHRFWRVRPLKHLTENFGLEFLQFRGAINGDNAASR